MSMKPTRFLFWCTVINYGLLIVWFVVFLFGHDLLLGLHSQWFHLSREQFDILNYAGMGIYKILIMVFNLVPLLVLWIFGRRQER